MQPIDGYLIFPGVSERLWSRVNQNGPVPAHAPELGPCWVWQGFCGVGGYGQFTVRRAGQSYIYKTHRLAWYLLRHPIPGRQFVLHKCDMPPCCNPSHLYLGTPLDNMRDKHARGRDRVGDHKGERNGRARLTAAQVDAIRARLADGAYQVDVAREFGMSSRTVNAIHRGKLWHHTHPSPANAVPRPRTRPMPGAANPNVRLTAAVVLAIRARYAAGNVTQIALAREYAVSPAMISNIVRRQNWTHLP